MNTKIRKATENDLSRIAEIYIFNNRINFYPIFKDPSYSFGELQVVPLANGLFKELLPFIYVYDDGIIKAFTQIDGTEIVKLFVDPFFQDEGIGHEMILFAIEEHNANFLWALEKNTRAIKFYNRHGFFHKGEKKLEEDTTEYLFKLVRK